MGGSQLATCLALSTRVYKPLPRARLQAACSSRLNDGDLGEIDAVIGAPVLLAK
jgi:hypothetical protein